MSDKELEDIAANIAEAAEAFALAHPNHDLITVQNYPRAPDFAREILVNGGRALRAQIIKALQPLAKRHKFVDVHIYGIGGVFPESLTRERILSTVVT
ncbi:MAG: hypothetical protein ACKV2T_29655 [Kofleriaceae bacterium]